MTEDRALYAGYACCWWARVLAAEQDAPAARTYRERALGALRARWTLPGRLQQALSADHAAAAAALEGAAPSPSLPSELLSFDGRDGLSQARCDTPSLTVLADACMQGASQTWHRSSR